MACLILEVCQLSATLPMGFPCPNSVFERHLFESALSFSIFLSFVFSYSTSWSRSLGSKLAQRSVVAAIKDIMQLLQLVEI